MLNGELKQLYTAITRARVNLWIFDENCDRRAPAFQYFIRREFVQVVKTDENKGKSGVQFFYRQIWNGYLNFFCIAYADTEWQKDNMVALGSFCLGVKCWSNWQCNPKQCQSSKSDFWKEVTLFSIMLWVFRCLHLRKSLLISVKLVKTEHFLHSWSVASCQRTILRKEQWQA